MIDDRSGKALEILLIEDNPDDVELTLHAFRKNRLSNQIHVLRDGAEAIDYFFGSGPLATRDVLDAPRVVLLDLKLPKVGGLEVLKRIKEDPRTQPIAVVVLTSSQEDRDIAEAYRLGANSYIVKPVDFEKFMEVANLLGHYWLLVNRPPRPAAPPAR